MATRVLVNVMNWGLGHAARCIPLIRELQRQGAEPILASDGRAYRLLGREFPECRLLAMPSYGIRYASRHLPVHLLLQAPRFLRALAAEHRFTAQCVERYQPAAIISDNRFGCFHRRVPSVFVTHQLHLRGKPAPLRHFANRVNRSFIRRFQQCWIPDYAGAPGLAGALSHPPLSLPTTYLGPLSRLSPVVSRRKAYDLLVLLSGPEPQRSLLERIVLQQLSALPVRALLVQGKTEEQSRQWVGEGVEVVSHLTSRELPEVFAKSRLVLCRSGYSTLMDLAATGQRAVLVPTPGQPEQEYLGALAAARGWFMVQSQSELDMQRVLQDGSRYPGISPVPSARPDAPGEAIGLLLG